MRWLLRVVHWGLLLLASYLLIPSLLGFFPPTQMVAEGLRGHIRGVLERLLDGVVAAIPNLLAILLILLITRLVMRACLDWFGAIERGQLQFPGFYREWARPTGRLVAAGVLLAGLVTAYPYIIKTGRYNTYFAMTFSVCRHFFNCKINIPRGTLT